MSKEFKRKEFVSNQKMMALALNNIGCYYKNKNKPNVALQYLK